MPNTPDTVVTLLPCPFCGERNARVMTGIRRVLCMTPTCDAEMSGETGDSAIKRWNTRMNQALDTADAPARGKTISDATRRMAKIMGAEFVPYDNPVSDTADEGMVERMTVWLYAREGGVAFNQLSYADQLHWRKQGRAAIEATGVSTLLARVEGWQPIETAPEGEVIIAMTCESSGQQWVTLAHREQDGRWFNDGDGLLFPTHWQNLPDPPKAIEVSLP